MSFNVSFVGTGRKISAGAGSWELGAGSWELGAGSWEMMPFCRVLVNGNVKRMNQRIGRELFERSEFFSSL